MEIDTIYNEDCLEGMRKMADGSVNAIVTSPPYNAGIFVNNATGEYQKRNSAIRWKGKPFNKYGSTTSDQMDMDEYFKWQCECIDEMMRVSTDMVFYNIQLLTGNKVALLKILGRYAENVRDVIIWDKMHPEPSMNPRTLTSTYEFIIVLDHGNCKARQFRIGNFPIGSMPNIIKIGANRENKEHRAAFPLALPKLLVHNFTNEGDIVLDPFIGSGTTAVACIQENRHFIGFETNPRYFDVATSRIIVEMRNAGRLVKPQNPEVTPKMSVVDFDGIDNLGV